MGKINVLPFAVANLIAAGEVVDRPASVIKELMENSIDAGATRITVEIQRGGVTLMRVTDDGCGMSPEDLPVAIKRHATSKISKASDLDGILTLGFRGEALAAIASVSDIRILTKTANAPYASMLEAHCGEVVGITEQGGIKGTSVIVENLFANVPARRKFLKKDITEAMAVATNVEKVALSHPEIAMRLIIDGTVKLETAGDGDLKNTVYAVYGREFASKLLEVNYEQDGITVRGFIGRTDNFKANRNYQNFFINGRFVKSRTAMAAIEQAYTSYMPPEKFPCCILFMDINPARVDVNVHPAKLEVKFSNEKPVFEAIYYGARTALEENSQRPSMELSFSKRDKRSVFADRGLMSQATSPVVDGRIRGEKPKQLSCDLSTPRSEVGQIHMSAQEYREKFSPAPAPTAPVASVISKNIQATPPVQEEKAPTPDSVPKTPAPTEPKEDVTVPVPEKKETVTAKEASAVECPTLSSFVPQEALNDPLHTLVSPTPDLVWDVSPDAKLSDVMKMPSKNEPVSDRRLEKPTEKPVEVSAPVEQTPIQEKKLPYYRIVGEVFHSYVIVECEDKMILVDKHAAHERIIFEQLKESLKALTPCSQLLMLPIDVMMTGGEVEALREYQDELERIGFALRYARNTVYVDAIPEGVQSGAVSDMLQTMADRILTATGSVKLTRDIIFEKALYQASCKAAVKAGRDYADGHIDWIIRKLMEIPDITFCPHGRPVALELSHKTIDRQFDRTGF